MGEECLHALRQACLAEGRHVAHLLQGKRQRSSRDCQMLGDQKVKV